MSYMETFGQIATGIEENKEDQGWSNSRTSQG